MSLDPAPGRRIFVQGQVRARFIVIGGIRGQNPPKMPRTEDQNMIQAVTPQRSNQPFRIWVLPGRTRRYWSVSDPHRPNPSLEDWTVCAVIVAHQIGRCCLPRKGLDNLLRQPLRGRMPGHGKPQQLSSSVADNDEGKQALEVPRWNHAQVDRSNRLRMIAQECPPALGGWTPSTHHVSGHRRLGEFEPQLEQFTMDPRSPPQWVFPVHPSDQITQFAIDPRSSCPLSRFPAPVAPIPRPMPPQDRRRLNNLGHTEQARPQPRHPHQQCAVAAPQRQTCRTVPQCNIELMTQKEVLCFKPTRRLKQIDDKYCKQAEDREHQTR